MKYEGLQNLLDWFILVSPIYMIKQYNEVSKHSVPGGGGGGGGGDSIFQRIL